MPAPTFTTIKANIDNAFISHGLVKYAFDSNGNPYATSELTPEQKKIIKAISEGIALTWAQWQASQTVAAAVQVAPTTGTGATIPAPGQLP